MSPAMVNEKNTIKELAKQIRKLCTKTESCLNCELGDQYGFCKLEGMNPREWRLRGRTREIDG